MGPVTAPPTGGTRGELWDRRVAGGHQGEHGQKGN